MAQIAVPATTPPQTAAAQQMAAMQAQMAASQQLMMEMEQQHQQEMQEWQQHLEAAGGDEQNAMAQGGRKHALVEPPCCGCIFCLPSGVPHQPAKIVRRPGCGTSVIVFDARDAGDTDISSGNRSAGGAWKQNCGCCSGTDPAGKSRVTFDCCIKEHSNPLAAACIYVCKCCDSCCNPDSGGAREQRGGYGGGGGGYSGGSGGSGGSGSGEST